MNAHITNIDLTSTSFHEIDEQMKEVARCMSWRLNIWGFGRCSRCGGYFNEPTSCSDHSEQVESEFQRQYANSNRVSV